MQLTCKACGHTGETRNGVEKAKGATAKDEKQTKFVVCDDCGRAHEISWVGKTITVIGLLPKSFKHP